MKKGFRIYDNSGSEKVCKFMELKGKDVGFGRYRIECYYNDGHARTTFTYTAKDYYSFIASHITDCYETWDEFIRRKTEVQQAIDKIKGNIKSLTNELEGLSGQL